MKNNISLIAITLFISTLFTSSFTSLAQAPGSLDLSFDTDGKVTTQIGTSNEGYSMAIQSDGKIVVAGVSYNGFDNDFALVRYNTNGSLDNTFDTDGKVTTNIGTKADVGNSVAIQSDGKIVVAGYSYNSALNIDVALVRYNSNGSLDSTFDTDGIVITDIAADDDIGNSLTIQPDGKLVVGGTSYNGSSRAFALLRYNTNGSLDNTFDTDGIVTTTLGTSDAVALSVALQGDGKIVMTGRSFNGSNNDIALARYNSNGSLDNNFDTDGIVITDIAAFEEVGSSVALQPDGKIVVAGYRYDGSTYDMALVRYNTNGSLDNTFDTDGIVTTDITGSEGIALEVAIQINGKIVIAGSIYNGINFHFALVRYNTNGSLDSTFDNDGIVTTSFTSDDIAYSLAIQPDGKIVVAGTDGSFVVARYNNTISTAINEMDNQSTEIKIYPNPFSTITTLCTKYFLRNATLTVYNLHAQEVKLIMNLTGKTITLNRDNLPSGLYFIQLTEDDKIISTNKLFITD